MKATKQYVLTLLTHPCLVTKRKASIDQMWPWSLGGEASVPDSGYGSLAVMKRAPTCSF